MKSKFILPKTSLTSLNLKCCKCGKVVSVTTSKLEVYTDEVKKKWMCGICKHKKAND